MTESNLKRYESGKLKVGRAISHSGEVTLALCLQSLDKAGVVFSASRIVSGVHPVATAFNQIMDFAVDADVDVLFHVASDVVISEQSVRRLLEVMDSGQHYLSVAKGYDPMFGNGASVGMLVWDMSVVGQTHRFRDVYRTDMEICERIEAATGLSRTYTPKEEMLGYHHPIWTPKDLYSKILYSYHKYAEKRQLHIRQFVADGLARNPENKVMLAGLAALERVVNLATPMVSKSIRGASVDLFEEDTKALRLTGSEYYVQHKAFKHFAQRVFKTHQNCVAIDEI